MALTFAHRPAATPDTPRPVRAGPRRILAVVVDLDDLAITLPIAVAMARNQSRELCVAVVRPTPLWTINAALSALLADRSHRETGELLAGVRAVTESAGLAPAVSLHLLRGLRGRRRREVLGRLVPRLARRYDAQSIGGGAS